MTWPKKAILSSSLVLFLSQHFCLAANEKFAGLPSPLFSDEVHVIDAAVMYVWGVRTEVPLTKMIRNK
jgi:hypothetical protein